MKEMDDNYRSITPEELQIIRKKPKTTIICGSIVLLIIGIMIIMLCSVFGSDDIVSSALDGLIGLFVACLGLLSVMYNDIKLFVFSKEMMVATVQVNEVKVKRRPHKGFVNFGVITVWEEGMMKQVEAGILKGAVEPIRQQRQAKLYFISEKCYVLDKISE